MNDEMDSVHQKKIDWLFQSVDQGAAMMETLKDSQKAFNAEFEGRTMELSALQAQQKQAQQKQLEGHLRENDDLNKQEILLDKKRCALLKKQEALAEKKSVLRVRMETMQDHPTPVEDIEALNSEASSLEFQERLKKARFWLNMPTI